MSEKDKKDQSTEELDPVMEEQPEKSAGEEHVAEKEKPAGPEAETEDHGAKVAALEKERDELRDKYLRLYAEFDNYKKRTLKERIELMKTAAQDTVAALLPVLDDFDRAKKNAESEESTEPFSEGVALVYQKLYNVLKGRGLEPMESNGEAFDPELHEAVTEIPASSEEQKGRIIDTIEKGYKLKDKIIRHAKVVVGK